MNDECEHTRMGHVQESASSVPLNTHVLGLCQSCQGSQSTGASNLCLVVFVRGQVCDATDGIALHFDIARIHLPNQRLQAS